MQLAAHRVQLGVVMGLERGLPLSFEGPHFGLGRTLVERTDHVVVFMRVYPECPADGEQEILLVELGISLDCVMLGSLRDLALLGQRFLLELFVRVVSHGTSESPSSQSPPWAGQELRHFTPDTGHGALHGAPNAAQVRAHTS